jgi:hypothetical protein
VIRPDTTVRRGLLRLLLAAAPVLALLVSPGGGAVGRAAPSTGTRQCVASSAPANSWTEVGAPEKYVYSQANYDDLNKVYPPFQRVYDPGDRCRAFRVSPDDASRIERSLDGGATWSTVYQPSPSAAGTKFNFRQIFVVDSRRVYVTETAAGATLVTSADGGDTWQSAAGGPMAGEYIYSLSASPSRPEHLYAITLDCYSRNSAVKANYPTCLTPPAQENGSVNGFNPAPNGQEGGYRGAHGPVRVYASPDAGVSWTRVLDPNTDPVNGVPDQCSMTSIFLVVDPYASYEHYWLRYDTDAANDTGGSGNPASPSPCTYGVTASFLIEVTSGSTTTTPAAAKDKAQGPDGEGFLVTRRPDGHLRLVGEEWYSDDDWSNPYQLPTLQIAERRIAALPDGSLFTFSKIRFGDNIGSPAVDTRAFVQRPDLPNGYGSLELGAHLRWPHYDQRIGDEFDQDIYGGLQVDAQGNVYLQVGEKCWQVNCDPANPDLRASDHTNAKEWGVLWHSFRYTPPAAGQVMPIIHLPVVPDHAPSCTGPACALNQVRGCTISGDPTNDVSGTLAFDGAALYYTRSREKSADPDPFSAPVHVVDPATCAELGTVTVHFGAADYSRAVDSTRRFYDGTAVNAPPPFDTTLPENRPSIDSLTYDPNGDRLLFTLEAQNAATGDSPESLTRVALWSAVVPRDGSRSTQAVLGGTDLGNCRYVVQPARGSEMLAFDRATGALWACLPARVAPVSETGQPIDFPCYGQPILMGEHSSSEWLALYGLAPGLQRPGSADRVFIWAPRSVAGAAAAPAAGGSAVYDYDLRTCTFGQVFSASLVQAGTGSSGLACDPVTYGPGGYGHGSGTASVGAVLWNRHGAQMTASMVPDPSLSCTLPVTASLAGPPTISLTGSSPVPVCGHLTIDGPGAPAVHQPIEVTVDGVPIARGLTDATGQLCGLIAGAAPATHQVGVSFAGNSAFFAATGGGVLSIVAPGVAAQPPPPPPGGGLRLPPPVIQPHVVVPAHQQPAPALGSVGGQTTTVPQSGAASEKERQIQLAVAGQGRAQDPAQAAEPSVDASAPPPDDTYNMVPLVAGSAAGLLALVLAFGAAPAPTRIPAPRRLATRARARRREDRR